MSKEYILSRFREVGVVIEGPFELTSGSVSDFYLDVKKAFGYPDILNAIADEISKRLPSSTTCIAGSGFGGLMLAPVVASRSGNKLLTVRDDPKKHGTGSLIEGHVPTERDIVTIVDDVLTTGRSIEKIRDILEGRGILVNLAFVVVRREIPITLRIPYSFIFTLKQVFEE